MFALLNQGTLAGATELPPVATCIRIGISTTKAHMLNLKHIPARTLALLSVLGFLLCVFNYHVIADSSVCKVKKPAIAVASKYLFSHAKGIFQRGHASYVGLGKAISNQRTLAGIVFCTRQHTFIADNPSRQDDAKRLWLRNRSLLL